MYSLDRKVTVITGAASGLGKSLAFQAAGEGARVIAVDMDEEGLREAASVAQRNGRDCEPFKADVSSLEEMQALADMVHSKYGHVDLLILAAGVGVGGRCHEFALDDWRVAIDVNIWGNVYGLHCFLPAMVERGEGHIVSISSGGGLFGLPHTVPYTASKFALVGMYESLGVEVAKCGIGVTTVCPTWMKTRFLDSSVVTVKDRRDEKRVLAAKWLYRHFAIEPQDAARKVVRAVKREKPLLLIGRETYLTYYLKVFFPGLYRRIMSFVSRFM